MCESLEDGELLARAQAAYARLAVRELKAQGVQWPIVPDRRWEVDDDVVTAWDVLPADFCGEPGRVLARWRWNGRRLARVC